MRKTLLEANRKLNKRIHLKRMGNKFKLLRRLHHTIMHFAIRVARDSILEMGAYT